jgi:hypothetical protein
MPAVPYKKALQEAFASNTNRDHPQINLFGAVG